MLLFRFEFLFFFLYTQIESFNFSTTDVNHVYEVRLRSIMSNKAQILFYFGGREIPRFTAAAQFGWFCNNDSFVLLEYKYWRLVFTL